MMAMRTTVGVFASRAEAERAVQDLRAAGYCDDQIGMIGKNANGETIGLNDNLVHATNVAEGALIGAAVGAVGTAAVGAGIMAGVIPVIGPVLALGPLSVTLINAATGGTMAGIAGALVGLGIPKDDALFFEEEVAAGRYLVTAEANGCRDAARNILGDNERVLDRANQSS
jgi:hypothetical protein